MSFLENQSFDDHKYGLLSKYLTAFVAQLGERKTEDLKVRGSIPRGGIFFFYYLYIIII